MDSRKLTDKQEVFCQEYLIDLNGTKALIRAGYSEKGAKSSASKLLAKGNVKKRINELKAGRTERTKLDLLRGLSVIGMILVITPGAWGQNYSWLEHADWVGLVVADMIFPTFLFCVGFSISISMTRKLDSGLGRSTIFRQLVTRACLLIMLGLFISWTSNFVLAELRIPGVLQRIGFCYMLVSALVLFTVRVGGSAKHLVNVRLLALVYAAVLILYWLLLYVVPVPGFDASTVSNISLQGFDSLASWPAYLDRIIFGIDHLWDLAQTDGVVTYGPEGVLASFPAATNTLMGAILGALYVQNSRYYQEKYLAGLGCGLFVMGFAISAFCPIVKKLWTSSFALSSAGVSVLLLLAFSYFVQLKWPTRLAQPLNVYDSNALLAFVVSWLGMMCIFSLPVAESLGGVSFRTLGYNFFKSYVSSSQLASLLFGLSFLVLFYIPLCVMYQKKLFVRL